MFRGFQHARVDDKGRVAVPQPFRKALSGLQDERLVATLAIDAPCVDVYPLTEWQKLEAELRTKSRFDPDIRDFRMVYVGRADELQLDNQKRINLPPLLRRAAGIERDVVISGDIEKFRIWDKQAWEQAFGEAQRRVREDRTFPFRLGL